MPVNLERECDVFCRHLTGAPAGEYVRAKYLAAHALGVVGEPADGFDAALARWAAAGPTRARWIDGYAVFFARTGLLRRKLVLLLAILESAAPSDRLVDRIDAGSRVGFLVHMGLEMALYAARLILAVIALTPVRVLFAGRRAPETG